MTNEYHTPVLVDKVLEYLVTNPDGVYLDATLGGGGHAEQLLRRLSDRGKLVAFDVDDNAIAFSKKRLRDFENRVTFLRENFVSMRNSIDELGVRSVDGILFDLGISSHQIDEPGRGFSFRRDEPLDMRMGQQQDLNATKFLHTVDEAELARIFRVYGEEHFAKRIARMVIQERDKREIETTGALASIVQKAVGRRFLNKSLARVFQALRIVVNNELENLRKALSDAVELLKVGSRAVVISYHSLEDRIVKEFFRLEAASGNYPETERAPRLRILTKKPIVPSEEEIASNNRSRSAKLRAAERI